ncbi:MAG: DUF1002 domain-containing protein [Lachnospiraceae bacterium]|nr:DUF1002 domain-containing protein [Lachnospiraceae bacterium]
MKKTRICKRIFAAMACISMAASLIFSHSIPALAEDTKTDAPHSTEDITEADEDVLDDAEQKGSNLDTTIVTLGADLTDEQRATVLSLLDLTEVDLEDCIVLEITNDDEHEYLDEYLAADVIGKRALSSIRLDKAEEGTGIEVTTNNINYCTEAMYVSALATAGLKDAEVKVAGPFSISGTAALVGTIKAYEVLTGEEISAEVIDTATDELVTTGKLSEELGDAAKATELIGFVKNEVVAGDVESEEDIRRIIEDAAKEMDITLSDESVDNIVGAMKKISKLDLDVDSLKKQAKGLYDKLKQLDINFDSEKAQGFLSKITEFFQKIFKAIKGWF